MIPHDLMQAILQDPADDLPRLIAADWLDENGDPDRAEFIRLGIEQNKFASHLQEFLNLTAKLKVVVGDHPAGKYADNVYKWFKDIIDMKVDVRIRRGFPDEIHCTLAEFMGGECRNCDEGRDRWREYDGTEEGMVREGDCLKCKGTGRIEGIAKRLGSLWPVTKVVLTDRRPLEFNGEWLFDTGNEFSVHGGRYSESVLPTNNFEGFHQITRSGVSDPDSSKLSMECVRYMRKLANLPELTHAVH